MGALRVALGTVWPYTACGVGSLWWPWESHLSPREPQAREASSARFDSEGRWPWLSLVTEVHFFLIVWGEDHRGA